MRLRTIGGFGRLAAGMAIAVIGVVAASRDAAAQSVGDPLDFVVAGNATTLVVGPNACDGYTAQSLGGLTLVGAASPGGPLLGKLSLPVSVTENIPTCPLFIVPGLPPATYWLALVYGAVTSVSVPVSAWKPVTIGGITCTGPPPPPFLLAPPSIQGDVVSFAFSGIAACAGAIGRLEIGLQPGRTDIAFDTPILGFTGAVPPGTYYVRARGRNAFGLGKPSLEVPIKVPNTCTTTGPQGPIAPTATVSPGHVTLSWTQTIPGTLFYVLRIANPSTGLALDHLVIPPTLSISAAVPPGTYRVGIGGGNECGVRFPITGDLIFTVP